MDQECFDALMKEIGDSDLWRIVDGLARTSEWVRRFATSLDHARTRCLTPVQGRPGCVLICRPSGANRLDAGILTRLGIQSQERLLVNLSPGAEIVNQGQLFGVGRRPGVFENAPGSVILVRGLENLGESSMKRFVAHVRAWQPRVGIPLVFFGADQGKLSILKEALQDELPTLLFHLPLLRNRREDIPFALHEAILQFSGGIDQFDVEAVALLLDHDWPGDLGQLESIVRDLCGPYGSDTAVRYHLDDISGALTRWEGLRRARTAFDQQDDQSLWLGVQRLTAEVDRRTMSLLGIPFFLYDTFQCTATPSTLCGQN